jgi:RHS repeat-associated protein
MRTVPASGPDELHYLLSDHLGSTTKLLDDQGGVVSEVKYWPYGGMRDGGITETDKLYTGQQIEPSTTGLGLYNYKARFYSTVLGRFVSSDPVMPSDSSQGLSRYSYVLNNPLRYSDPSGHAHADAIRGSESVRACARDVMNCLRWSSGGNLAQYITLVGRHFGIDPAVLAAIVWNESSNWKVKYGMNAHRLSIDRYAFVPGRGGYGFDDLQADTARAFGRIPYFSKLPRVGRLANPTIGPAQITLSLAERLERLGYVNDVGRDRTISLLQTVHGAFFYAAAHLAELNKEYLGPAGLHNSARDLIAAWLVGGKAWNQARIDYGCGYCKPGGDAPKQVNKVYPMVAEAREALRVGLQGAR